MSLCIYYIPLLYTIVIPNTTISIGMYKDYIISRFFRLGVDVKRGNTKIPWGRILDYA